MGSGTGGCRWPSSRATWAGDASFLPAASEDRQLLLDVYLLEKALYELGYELTNRPAWADVPLRGIVELLDGPPPSRP